MIELWTIESQQGSPLWGRQVSSTNTSGRSWRPLCAVSCQLPGLLTGLTAAIARAQHAGTLLPRQLPTVRVASTTQSQEASLDLPTYQGLSPSFLTQPY